MDCLGDFMYESAHKHAEDFISYWREQDADTLESYRKICTDAGCLEGFEKNPLGMVHYNKPACCHHIAESFGLKQLKKPFVTNGIYFQRSPCDWNTWFYYRVTKICKKTIAVIPVHKHKGYWESSDRPARLKLDGCSANNESRRIFLKTYKQVE